VGCLFGVFLRSSIGSNSTISLTLYSTFDTLSRAPLRLDQISLANHAIPTPYHSTHTRTCTRIHPIIMRYHPLPDAGYDSDSPPSALERGRDPSPKRLPHLHSTLTSPPPSRRSSRVKSTSVSLASPTYTAHHHLPSADESGAILYLPPLMSGLPEGVEGGRAARGAGQVGEGSSQEQELEDMETRLPDIDPASLALHQALHFFHPLDAKYASTLYSSAFNWSSLVRHFAPLYLVLRANQTDDKARTDRAPVPPGRDLAGMVLRSLPIPAQTVVVVTLALRGRQGRTPRSGPQWRSRHVLVRRPRRERHEPRDLHLAEVSLHFSPPRTRPPEWAMQRGTTLIPGPVGNMR
jgi:hypothetical protein